MKLRFTPRATADLLAIADYIRAHNPNAALRVRAAILDCIRNIALFPEVGQRQAIEGVRKIVTRSIRISLDENAEEIVIITIQHAARRREHEDA